MIESPLISAKFKLFALAFLTISACSNNAATGAGVGAAVGGGTGAIIGHQSGHGGEGALVGAGVGALAGGTVGAAVPEDGDSQTADLDEVIRLQKKEMERQSQEVEDMERQRWHDDHYRLWLSDSPE